MVTALLKGSTDDDFEQSRFWDALSKLARTRDWPRDEYNPGSPYRRTQGRAEMIAGLEPLVVVILYMADARYPGEDVQKLLLLDRRGRIRDTLSCSINNRLVFWGGGLFRTDLPLNTQRDGAQLIVRYIPKDGGAISGNFAHEIHHDGQIYSFHWDEDRPQSKTADPWGDNGLCRIVVEDGKFKVLFPRLEGPTQ